MCPRKIRNEEVGNDVIEVLCISSDSDVSLYFLVSEFWLPTFPGACVFRVVRSVLFLNSRKAFATQVALNNFLKKRDKLQHQR